MCDVCQDSSSRSLKASSSSDVLCPPEVLASEIEDPKQQANINQFKPMASNSRHQPLRMRSNNVIGECDGHKRTPRVWSQAPQHILLLEEVVKRAASRPLHSSLTISPPTDGDLSHSTCDNFNSARNAACIGLTTRTRGAASARSRGWA